MNSLFSAFHKIIGVGFTSIGIIVSSVLPSSSHHTQLPQHAATTPAVAQHMITLQKTVDTMGKKVTILLSMPKDGGVIDGTVSGDCQGAIDGNYSGEPGYTMSGKG